MNADHCKGRAVSTHRALVRHSSGNRNPGYPVQSRTVGFARLNQDSTPPGLPPAGRFALLAALSSSIGQTFFIGLFGAEFRSAFALSDAQFGLLYSVATLISGLSMFWLGALIDHVRLSRAVAVVLSVLAVGAGLVAIAQNAAALLLGLFLLRLAGQGLMGHLAVVAAGRFALRRRGRALAMVSYGFIIGEACLPPLVAGLLQGFDWRTVWLGASLLLAGLALPILYLLARPMTGNPAGALETESSTQPIVFRRRDLFSQGAFVRVLLIILVPPVLVTALFLHQGAIAERQGWTLTEVGSAFVLFAVLQAAAAFSAGRLIDRFGARALLRVQLLPGALAVLALGWLSPGPALWLMFAGLGLLSGLNSVIGAAIWIELFGTRQLGMIRGVHMALMVLGTAAGPVVLGALLDRGVSLATFGLGVSLWIVLVPLLVVPGIRTRVPGRVPRDD